MERTPRNSATQLASERGLLATVEIEEPESADAPAAEQRRTRKRNVCPPLRLHNFLSTLGILCALLLIVGSIYMHLRQKHHFGRMNSERSSKSADTTIIVVSEEPSVAAQITAVNVEQLQPETVQLLPIATSPASTATTLKADTTLFPDQISKECLYCIARTATDCKPVFCSDNRMCGIYRISQWYWSDALSYFQWPSTPNINECLSDPLCSMEVVRAYIERYSRDCNYDGIVDCRDHILLHLKGPSGCLNGALGSLYESRMETCLETQSKPTSCLILVQPRELWSDIECGHKYNQEIVK
ncbi:uncharacterized protein LOC115632125 isoform X1 [Scaptodrosophila lebanonensis]|uniref:lysozyme n=1 Tax=Drosophila lebanonensis TaxID=7225 RepID=A0A6J2U916_DROLE|nr:uncharacterized protein LOC115632125 isoform X1 [Scaptodrosophila lebanonensis]